MDVHRVETLKDSLQPAMRRLIAGEHGWKRPVRLRAQQGAFYLPDMRGDVDSIEPTIRQALRECARGDSPWPLLLTGDAGVGKTYAAICFLNHIDYGCKYTTLGEAAEELIMAMKGELWDAFEKINTRMWWHNWKKATCVVLDEIGVRGTVTDHQYDTLKRCIDERERVAGPSIFISNKNVEALSMLYDDRIASRLACGTVVHLEGDDLRLR